MQYLSLYRRRGRGYSELTGLFCAFPFVFFDGLVWHLDILARRLNSITSEYFGLFPHGCFLLPIEKNVPRYQKLTTP